MTNKTKGRPLARPTEGPRQRINVRLSAPMLEILETCRRDLALSSKSDAMDFLVRMYGVKRHEIIDRPHTGTDETIESMKDLS